MSARFSLKVDPGGQHTGICLTERTAYGLMPIDGLTLDRTHEERDTQHAGCPTYCRRVIDACWAMLDGHAVADDELSVYLETLLPPTPMPVRGAAPGTPRHVPMAVWRHQLAAWAVLGAVAATWPDAVLVAPADHDHAVAGYPSVLRGRTPAGWTAGGGSARVHQRAAWAMGLAGMRHQRLSVTRVPDEVEAAVRAARLAGGSAGLGVLLTAVRKTADKGAGPEQIAGWAFTAAKIIRPETPETLRERLFAKATEAVVA